MDFHCSAITPLSSVLRCKCFSSIPPINSHQILLSRWVANKHKRSELQENPRTRASSLSKSRNLVSCGIKTNGCLHSFIYIKEKYMGNGGCVVTYLRTSVSDCFRRQFMITHKRLRHYLSTWTKPIIHLMTSNVQAPAIHTEPNVLEFYCLPHRYNTLMANDAKSFFATQVKYTTVDQPSHSSRIRWASLSNVTGCFSLTNTYMFTWALRGFGRVAYILWRNFEVWTLQQITFSVCLLTGGWRRFDSGTHAAKMFWKQDHTDSQR